LIDVVRKVQHFLVSEEGPTAVEYGVMLALIIAVCALIVANLGTTVSTTFSGVNSSFS